MFRVSPATIIIWPKMSNMESRLQSKSCLRPHRNAVTGDPLKATLCVPLHLTFPTTLKNMIFLGLVTGRVQNRHHRETGATRCKPQPEISGELGTSLSCLPHTPPRGGNYWANEDW